MTKLGEFIKEFRKEKNMSLREFAHLCDLSHSYIASLEKGIDPRNNKPVVPTIDTFKKISNAIGYPLDELLEETGYIENDEKENKDKITTKAYHNLNTEGLPEEDIKKVEEYIELLKQKYNPDGTLKKK